MITRFESTDKSSSFAGLFSEKTLYLWEKRFLPKGLPLLVGAVLGLFLAVLIVNQEWNFLIFVVLLPPAVILFSRYPFISVTIWMLAFPFFVRTSDTAGRYMYWILHRAMIPTALIYVIVSQWLGVGKRLKSVRWGIAELAMVIFLGLAVINIFLFNNNPKPQLYHLFDYLFVPFSMYWLVRLVNPGAEDTTWFLWVACFTVIVQGAIGLLGWFSPQVLPAQWLSREGERTVGTFGNPAVYSSTLIFLSLFLFRYAVKSASGRIRTLLFCVVGLAFFCVFFTFSRGSWLGLVFVLLGLVYIYPKVIMRMIVVATILIVFLGSSFLADEFTYALERLNTQNTAESRIVGNKASIEMIKAKPLMGWGYGKYDLYDDQFKGRVFNIAVRSDATSHNTYLTVMAEMGVIGFLFYLFPVLYWFRDSIRVWRYLPEREFWGRNMLIMLWLLMLDHVVVSSFMDMVRFHLFGTTVWWMALGFIANMVYPHNSPRRDLVAQTVG